MPFKITIICGFLTRVLLVERDRTQDSIPNIPIFSPFLSLFRHIFSIFSSLQASNIMSWFQDLSQLVKVLYLRMHARMHRTHASTQTHTHMQCAHCAVNSILQIGVGRELLQCSSAAVAWHWMWWVALQRLHQQQVVFTLRERCHSSHILHCVCMGSTLSYSSRHFFQQQYLQDKGSYTRVGS